MTAATTLPTIDPNEPLSFELWLPASKLAAAVEPKDDGAKQDSRDALSHLRTAASALARAHVAVLQYEHAFAAEGSLNRAHESDDVRAGRRELERQCAADIGIDPDNISVLQAHQPQIAARFDRYVERLWWVNGQVPPALIRAQLEMAYRECIFAIEDVRRLLDGLGGLSVMTPTARDSIKTARKNLDHLRLLRDSLSHVEDRSVGRDKKGRPIEWQNPAEVGFHVGAVIKSTMVQYGPNFVRITAGDGTHPTLIIALEYVAQVRDMVQAVIDGLEWDPDGWGAMWVP